MAYGRNFGSDANGDDAALASQIMQLTREREQRKWAADQQEQMRRQQVKDANAQAFDEAGRMPRESSPAFLATGDGRTGYIEDGAFIPSQVDALADRNRQLMEGYRMQGVQTRAAQKERENLQNVALCGMIQSAQQNGGFVDPSMLGMVNQQLGDGTVKCIGGDTDGRGNLRIYGEAGNGQRGVMLTLSRQQQAALMGKTPGVEGGQAFVEKYLTDQIANGVSYEDAMRELGLDPGKMKSGASAAMRGERAASGGRASAQEKFDKEWFGHLMEQMDALDREMASEGFAAKSKEEQDAVKARRQRYADMLEAYENNFAARYPTAKQQEENLKLQTNEAKAALAAQEKELRQIDAALGKQAFDAAFQNGRLAGSGSWRGADGEEVLKYNGRRYAVGEAVDLGNGVMATWLGGGIEPENFELVAEETPAPDNGGEGEDFAAEEEEIRKEPAKQKSAPTVTEEAVMETPKGEAAVAVEEPAKEDKEDNMPRYERWGRNIGDVVMAAVGEVKAKGMDVADAAKYIGNKVADAYMAASDYLTETPKQEREKAERRAGDWAQVKELEERNARNAERLAKEKDRMEAQDRERRQARARADVEKATADLVDFNEQMKRIGEEYERKQAQAKELEERKRRK